MPVIAKKIKPFYFDEDLFNPVFIPYIDAKESTQLFTGNRGSGKTIFNLQKALLYCIHKKYFRIGYGMKVNDEVRDRLFLALKDLIKEWEVEQYFQVKESTMDVVCRIQGNMMLSFGMDKPDKVKGLQDVSHIFMDEMDKFSFDDFANLRALLRTSKAPYKQLWGCFNPEYNFWGRQFFFENHQSDKIPLSEVAAKTSNTLILKASFKDNPFVDPVEYEANLRELARGNKNYLTVWIDGDWGESATGNEYFVEFNRAIHVKNVPFLPGKPIHLSYDINSLPYMTQLCAQVYFTADKEIEIRIFKEYCLRSPYNTKEAVCKAFLSDYSDKITDLFIYGDASGNSRIPGEGDSNSYDKIESVLYKYLNNASKRVLRYNPSVLKRRDYMNDILAEKIIYNGSKVSIVIDESCTELINDMNKLKLGMDGKLKKRISDKQTGLSWEELGHCGDALEYYVIRLLWDDFKKRN